MTVFVIDTTQPFGIALDFLQAAGIPSDISARFLQFMYQNCKVFKNLERAQLPVARHHRSAIEHQLFSKFADVTEPTRTQLRHAVKISQVQYP